MKPSDDTLLADIIEDQLTIPELARRHGMSLTAVAERVEAPRFQKTLATLLGLAETRERFHAISRRTEAVAALRPYLAKDADPEPRRKAADSILRAVRHIPAPRPVPPPSPPPPEPAEPSRAAPTPPKEPPPRPLTIDDCPNVHPRTPEQLDADRLTYAQLMAENPSPRPG